LVPSTLHASCNLLKRRAADPVTLAGELAVDASDQFLGELRGQRRVVRDVGEEMNGRPVVVSGSQDDTVWVWDLATGQPVGYPFIGNTGNVHAGEAVEKSMFTPAVTL
jgi:hypothetical protein